ncbi:MAG: hypothetical protein ACPIOQ_82190 [Promethearchaeia archaeon]
MRKTLVNWLVEVHFKFRFREPCLHLTLQLSDRYLSRRLRAGLEIEQHKGVIAIQLGCKCEERHNPNLGDLSCITDCSTSHLPKAAKLESTAKERRCASRPACAGPTVTLARAPP